MAGSGTVPEPAPPSAPASVARAAFAGGEVELLADADRPGGWLLLLDRIRQSYVDLDDPTYLDFEYVQAFADAVGGLPPGPLAVTHIGGGAATLARWVAAVRPGSTQVVLEPDERLTALVRARLPFPRGARIRVRPVDGRGGLPGLRSASADVLVVDAFAGGRVPAELTTVEAAAGYARVLRAGGLLLVNVADGPPLTYTRRTVAAMRTALPDIALRADPAVLRGRRFGNVVLVAARSGLPVAGLVRAASSAMFAQRLVSGADLDRFVGTSRPLTDADPLRSPAPPDELWRVR